MIEQKKKLRLEDIQVESFVTQMDTDLAHTVQGGDMTLAACLVHWAQREIQKGVEEVKKVLSY